MRATFVSNISRWDWLDSCMFSHESGSSYPPRLLLPLIHHLEPNSRLDSGCLTRIIIPLPSKPFESRCSSLSNLMICFLTRPVMKEDFESTHSKVLKIIASASALAISASRKPGDMIEKMFWWLAFKTLRIAWAKLFYWFHKITII